MVLASSHERIESLICPGLAPPRTEMMHHQHSMIPHDSSNASIKARSETAKNAKTRWFLVLGVGILVRRTKSARRHTDTTPFAPALCPWPNGWAASAATGHKRDREDRVGPERSAAISGSAPATPRRTRRTTELVGRNRCVCPRGHHRKEDTIRRETWGTSRTHRKGGNHIAAFEHEPQMSEGRVALALA